MKIPWRKWRWFEPPSNFHGRQRWFRSQICVSSKFTRRCSSWKKHTRWVGHCWILRRGCGFSAWWGRSFAASTAGCDAASDSSGNTRQGADSRAGWAGVLEKTPVFFREVLSWFESTIFIKIHWEDVRFFDLFVMFRIFSLGWGQLFKTIPHGPVVPAVFLSCFHHWFNHFSHSMSFPEIPRTWSFAPTWLWSPCCRCCAKRARTWRSIPWRRRVARGRRRRSCWRWCSSWGPRRGHGGVDFYHR